MRNVGTTARGIRTPIIKKGDDIAQLVVDSVIAASISDNFPIRNTDVVGITEAVVSIALGNYATTDDVAEDVRRKFPLSGPGGGPDGGLGSQGQGQGQGERHIGLLFPSPTSRNRFSPFLKGIARAADKITMQMSFPTDVDIGNIIIPDEMLDEHNIKPTDLITQDYFDEHFSSYKHLFTGVNYVQHFREVAESENCKIEFLFANDPRVILDYAQNILVGCIHSRDKYKKILVQAGAAIVHKLDEIMTESINGSGYNATYGLLGSNRSTDEQLKLFPHEAGQQVVERVQDLLYQRTGKAVEVMIFADGAFKDPIGGIWELADPVVSPAYTKGLEGTPNELKLKYLSDSKFADIRGEELAAAMRAEIKEKPANLVGSMAAQGTTPRRYTDLIGSLCDLISGSGDKGTPVVLVQGYFDNYAD